VNSLSTELATYSEEARKSSKDCAILSSKVSAFEVCALNSSGKFAFDHLAYHYACFQETCNSQQEQIETLQKHLADATEKLKVRKPCRC
jgi:kinesin family protein C1